ncbi:hypothetical protein BKA62DRAFT_713807 [Auriculariales sp. MPI-PUGE-AT-0066]|nr:hypothetical protein BKA62DRAFT_713807 [Auriculariales sp. MPI-PUGE-AT-0066]
MSRTTTTLEDLTTKFPSLDSSLIAALYNDRDSCDATDMAKLDAELELLHLESFASEDSAAWTSDPAGSSTDNGDTASEWTSPDYSETSSSSPSSRSGGSVMLQFLTTAFPHLPSYSLEAKLQDGSAMQNIVEVILSEEYIRELEERGIDGLEDDLARPVHPPLAQWIEPQRKKKKERGRTIVLGDVRQGGATALPTQPKPRAAPTPTAAVRRAMDESPWIRLDSISLRLAQLIPTATPATFLSPFHDPKHATPAAALRFALAGIAQKCTIQILPETLRFLLETFPPEDLAQDADAALEDVALKDDASLCLRAAQGSMEDAIDVLTILRDFAKAPQYGTVHAPAPSTPLIATSSTISQQTLRLVPQRASTAPPEVTTFSQAAAANAKRATTSNNSWQTVERKKKPPPAQPPHSDFIPAYRVGGSSRNPRYHSTAKVQAAGYEEEVTFHRIEARALQRERTEALRHAMRYWRQGNARNLGGEVAIYYAERARELYDAAHTHSLDAARVTVNATRRSTASHDEIDLHGLTIAEAAVVVKEVLKKNPPTPDRPLRIITGKGMHSREYKTVLQPALMSRLSDDGWTVKLWDAGLTVRGRTNAAR